MDTWVLVAILDPKGEIEAVNRQIHGVLRPVAGRVEKLGHWPELGPS